MSISHRNGATGFKVGHGWNIIMYWKEKVDSLYNWTLRKISITSKYASNKNWSEWNFIQKLKGADILSFPGVAL